MFESLVVAKSFYNINFKYNVDITLSYMTVFELSQIVSRNYK